MGVQIAGRQGGCPNSIDAQNDRKIPSTAIYCQTDFVAISTFICSTTTAKSRSVNPALNRAAETPKTIATVLTEMVMS
jgi:hypothetical protein